jgi:hypothetical protein
MIRVAVFVFLAAWAVGRDSTLGFSISEACCCCRVDGSDDADETAWLGYCMLLRRETDNHAEYSSDRICRFVSTFSRCGCGLFALFHLLTDSRLFLFGGNVSAFIRTVFFFCGIAIVSLRCPLWSAVEISECSLSFSVILS